MRLEGSGKKHGGVLATRAVAAFTPERDERVESSSACATKAKEACLEMEMMRRCGGQKKSEVGATEKGERYERSSVATMATVALASTERRRERERGDGSGRKWWRRARRVLLSPFWPRPTDGVAVVAATCPRRGMRVLPQSATAASASHAGALGGRRGAHGGAGLASASGPEVRQRPAGARSPFSFFLNFFSQLYSNPILANLKAFSEFAPRTKVVQNKFLYNFALRCNFKF